MIDTTDAGPDCTGCDEGCQECCEHGDYEHGFCLTCDKDCTEDLVGAAESYHEGDR